MLSRFGVSVTCSTTGGGRDGLRDLLDLFGDRRVVLRVFNERDERLDRGAIFADSRLATTLGRVNDDLVLRRELHELRLRGARDQDRDPVLVEDSGEAQSATSSRHLLRLQFFKLLLRVLLGEFLLGSSVRGVDGFSRRASG